jgi:hypothetical protein
MEIDMLKHCHFLLLACFILLGSQVCAKEPRALLEGSISLYPTRPQPDEEEKIQPGTAVKIVLVIKNMGDAPSPAGEVFVRYAFAKPLDKQANSVLFKTEKVAVSKIEPGQYVEVAFKTLHHLPALFDFVREDWIMREYQAIFEAPHSEALIGILPLTVSAYYYSGTQRAIPASISP